MHRGLPLKTGTSQRSGMLIAALQQGGARGAPHNENKRGEGRMVLTPARRLVNENPSGHGETVAGCSIGVAVTNVAGPKERQ
jgi:hypothetical protein